MLTLVVAFALAEEPVPAPPAAAPAAAEPAAAADPVAPADPAAEAAQAAAAEAAFLASLQWRDGDVPLGDGLATAHLPATLRYLGPADTDRVLQSWGNPPSPGTLGAVFPKDVSPFAKESWCFVLSYSDDGHVTDDDAGAIDYAALLEDMKRDADADGAARAAQGLASVSLVGWAAPPRYDAATHVMYWAKDLTFGGDPEHTLNYNVRVLGRDGVLQMSGIGSLAQLPLIQEQSAPLLSAVTFDAGHRYEDFVPGTDHTAAYGLAGLVAGGAVAAKAGAGKGIVAVLLASKKLLIAGGVAAIGGVRALLGMRKKDEA